MFFKNRFYEKFLSKLISSSKLNKIYREIYTQDLRACLCAGVNTESVKFVDYLLIKKVNLWAHFRLTKANSASDLREYFFVHGYNNLNWCMSVAAEKGFINIMKYFIFRGANLWNWGMHDAVNGCNRNLVDYFISRGASFWSGSIDNAIIMEYKDLAMFFMAKGAEIRNSSIFFGEKAKTDVLIKYYKKKILI